MFLFLLITAGLLAACGLIQPSQNLQVITHPDGQLYVGDQVSFEVLGPPGETKPEGNVEVSFQGRDLGQASFTPFGIGNRQQATLFWAWDTRGLQPGHYTLTFTRLPEGPAWSETLTLLPQNQVPAPEPEAHWAELTTTCCDLYYITGTDAARDIQKLGQEADHESASVSEQLAVKLNRPITVYLMSRVIGQGGFTLSDIYLSYLDANYVSSDMPILFHHEFVHYYDSVAGGTYRPPIFEEGLAVYLSGGHFKPEPLYPRAAALLASGGYIPLTTVANDFYNQQHDTGYLEAASLVKYLVVHYGWQAFNSFYRDIPEPHGRTNEQVIDTALRQHFGISFSDLETAYQASLRAQSFTPAERSDLQVTLAYFDTVRRYQQILDPSAYFLTAWLPDGPTMRQRGIVADLLRHPEGWENRLSENLLAWARSAWADGNYSRAGRILEGENAVLGLFSLR